MCPILPFINDTEENLYGILNYCIEAKVYGIINFGMGMTLRDGTVNFFYNNWSVCFPDWKENYCLFGNQYILPSPNEKRLLEIFSQTCDKHHIVHDSDKILEYLRTYQKKMGRAPITF